MLTADYYFTFCEFFTLALADYLSLESEWYQASSSLLDNNILADLNNTIIWIVSIPLLISNSSSPLSKPFRTLPSAPITTDNIVDLMFYSFLSSQAKSKYLSLRLLCFSLCWNSKVHNTANSFFFLAGMNKVCFSNSLRILCVSFFKTDSGLCIYIWWYSQI